MSTPKEMQLEELRIRRGLSYNSENPDSYYAEAELSSPRGKINLPMGPEISNEMVRFLAPLIAKFGSEAAQELANIALKSVDRGATVELLSEKAAS